jgi:hypothetical protein
VQPGDTILFADGVHPVKETGIIATDRVTPRDESGHRGRLVLDDEGTLGEMLALRACSDVITVHDPGSRLGRLIRLVQDNDGLRVIDNLLSGPPPRIELESKIERRGNRSGDFTVAFAVPEEGNLRLTAAATDAIDRTVPVPEVTTDIDRKPHGAAPDVGAHDFPGSLSPPQQQEGRSPRSPSWNMLSTQLTAAIVLMGMGAEAAEEPGRTTLSVPSTRFTVPEEPYVVLARGAVEAIVVDNRAVDDAVLRGHRAGYSGLAALRHARRRENLFVAAYAGLNFEHIHDGTKQPWEVIFEPRKAPMELRRIDDHTAELYQRATPQWGLESCLRYELLPDGAIEMTLECIPRRRTFRNGYIGLFWASYIDRPSSGAIHFLGHPAGGDPTPRWIEATSPDHGVRATHLAADDRRDVPHDWGFPFSLVFSFSGIRYDEPWYYGVSHGMAYAQVFRPRDHVRLTQSPSGGGEGNPAWDFQAFIPDYEVGRRYTLVMRALYLPYESPEQVRRAIEPHRHALERP